MEAEKIFFAVILLLLSLSISSGRINSQRWSKLKREDEVSQPEEGVTEHEENAEEITEHVENAEEITEHVENPEEVTEHVENPEEVTEHVENPEEITEHVENLEEVTEHVENPEEVTENVENPEEVTEHVENPEEVTEHVENPEEVTEHVENPEEVTEHVENPEEVTEHVVNMEGRVSEHEGPKGVTPKCGSSQSVSLSEKFTFNLDAKNCSYGFTGSRREKCRVEIVCSPMEFTTKDCKKSYFQLTDGLQGLQKTCAAETFTTPFRASNKGYDLYVNYIGPIPNTICNVSCFEDRTNREVKRKFLTKGITRHFEGKCVCGEKPASNTKQNTKGRIVGGSDAQPFEFPWLASFVHKGTRKSFCGGALINNEYIVTAAHCLFDITVDDFEIVLHSHIMDLNTNKLFNESAKAGQVGSIAGVRGLKHKPVTDADEHSIRMTPREILMMSEFDPVTKDYDVALVRLSKKIDLKNNKLVRPICLPPETNAFEYSEKNTTVAGWGRPDALAGAGNRILQKLDIPLFFNKKCRRLMQEHITPRMICGGFLGGGKDSCSGDSGGPVIFKFNKKQHRLVGVVSFGIGCAERGLPGVYTSIQEVIQWIYKSTESAWWCKDS